MPDCHWMVREHLQYLLKQLELDQWRLHSMRIWLLQFRLHRCLQLQAWHLQPRHFWDWRLHMPNWHCVDWQ